MLASNQPAGSLGAGKLVPFFAGNGTTPKRAIGTRLEQVMVATSAAWQGARTDPNRRTKRRLQTNPRKNRSQSRRNPRFILQEHSLRRCPLKERAGPKKNHENSLLTTKPLHAHVMHTQARNWTRLDRLLVAISLAKLGATTAPSGCD